MKVVLYARVSTEEQKTNDEQINELKRYCELYKHEIVNIYKDKQSGLTTDRENFQRMLKDVKENDIEGVLIWRFDRLSRSLKDLNETANFLKDNNVQLISMHELVDTSKPEGKLLFHILGSLAEYEVDVIRTRTILGLEKAKKEGKICHRPKKEVNIERVKKAINDGFTLDEIAKMQSVTYVTLKKRLDEAGIELVRGAKIKK